MNALPHGSHIINNKHEFFQFNAIIVVANVTLFQLKYKPQFQALEQCKHDRNFRIRSLEGCEKL
jgi:hypothetical protein